jgi:hypothetical protein
VDPPSSARTVWTDSPTRLVAYLSREDAIKSLLQWVISGLDELDQEAVLADSISFDHAMISPEAFPRYKSATGSGPPAPVPGPGPDSPPLEPGKLGDEGIGEEDGNGLSGLVGRDMSDADAQRQKWVNPSMPDDRN